MPSPVSDVCDSLHSDLLQPLGITFWPHDDGSISYFLADGTFVYLSAKSVRYLHRYFRSGRWWDCELCAGLADLLLTQYVCRWRDMPTADAVEILDLVGLLVYVYQRS